MTFSGRPSCGEHFLTGTSRENISNGVSAEDAIYCFQKHKRLGCLRISKGKVKFGSWEREWSRKYVWIERDRGRIQPRFDRHSFRDPSIGGITSGTKCLIILFFGIILNPSRCFLQLFGSGIVYIRKGTTATRLQLSHSILIFPGGNLKSHSGTTELRMESSHLHRPSRMKHDY